MSLVSGLRARLSDGLFKYTASRHKSRLFFPEARKFTKYLKHCQSVAPVREKPEAPFAQAAADFEAKGFAAFSTAETTALAKSMLAKIKAEEAAGLDVWNSGDVYSLGDAFSKFEELQKLFHQGLGKFLNGVFGTQYAIHAAALYRSVRKIDQPEGSQIWHADGGPGTCINVMFCLTPTSAENGAMKCLPWDYSLQVFEKERPIVRERTARAVAQDPKMTREQRRSVISNFYREQIEGHYADKIAQPTGDSGLVYAFRNNCIHAGGFPQPGQERIVWVVHVYPSVRDNLDWCRQHGTKEVTSYPTSPDVFEKTAG